MPEPTYTSPNGTVYIAGGKGATCTLSVCPVEFSVYGYRPSIAASSVLIGLYAVVIAAQVLLGWRHRSWGFMSAMLLGCVDEILGYVGRILLYQNPWNNAGFIMQIGEWNALRSRISQMRFADPRLLDSANHNWACLLLWCDLLPAARNVSLPPPTHLSSPDVETDLSPTVSSTSPSSRPVSRRTYSTTFSSPATSSV